MVYVLCVAKFVENIKLQKYEAKKKLKNNNS